jgi:putative flippase GtrA
VTGQPVEAQPGGNVRGLGMFAVTGGIAAACNLGSRAAFSLVMSYSLAIILAYVVGMVTAFVLARQFVFRPAEDGVVREFLRFAGVNVAALAQVWAVSVGLVTYVFPWAGFEWHPETVAHVIGVASPIFSSYFLHKHFTFRAAAARKTPAPERI